MFRDDSAQDAAVLAWSHDGSHLIVRIEPRDERARFELVDLATGDRAPLGIPVPTDVPSAAAFSPDDRFVVFDAPPSADGRRSLHVVPAAGGSEWRLLDGDADDAEPFWVGDQVLFSSTRSARRGLWRVAVADGHASTPPTLISDQLAAGFWSVGATETGSFYYAASEGLSSVYTADLTAGGEIGTPSRISAADTPAVSPEWSPDGGVIAWISRPLAGGSSVSSLRLHDLGTGAEHEIKTSFAPGANLRWSRDGTRLVVRGTDDKGGGVRLIDARTGDLLNSFLVGRPGDVAWTVDGTRLFYLDPKGRAIGTIDVGSGDQHAFYRLPSGYAFERGIAVSPQEDRIAYAVSHRDGISIQTIAATGGTPRTLVTVRPPHRIALQQWTRDGRHILFARSRAIPGAPASQEWQLWSVGRDGGDPRYLDFSMPNLSDVRPSPDGARLVFSSSNAENRLRVLENVFTDVIARRDR